jgi:SMC interacting uncharacterized protein involved in chromosome segregation
MLQQIKQLQDELLAKEEENYITIVNLKEENQKLQRQLKTAGAGPQKAGSNEREVAKLSVENEMLKKQVEDLQSQVATQSLIVTPTRVAEAGSMGSGSGSREAEELKVKLHMLRDENSKLKQIDLERRDIEEQLVQSKIKSANLDLENDQLAQKLQTKNEQIKMFGERITAYEVEILKTKQELGEALNAVYEYEQGAGGAGMNDRQMMSGGTVAFGGSGNLQNDSGNEYTNSEGDT